MSAECTSETIFGYLNTSRAGAVIARRAYVRELQAAWKRMDM